MRNAIVVMLAATFLAALAGCDIQAQPGTSTLLGHQVDWAGERTWWLTREQVMVNSAQKGKTAVTLPGWTWVGEPLCPPDLALGPSGEAVVTSNVIPTLWRIDPQTLVVSVHELQLDSDTDKDVGFAAIVYSPEQAAFFAYSETQRSVWKIDRELRRATKMALGEASRVRAHRAHTLRGPCAYLGQRLTHFAAIAGD
jgi:hypothetical protein